jgi:hypothetical protein
MLPPFVDDLSRIVAAAVLLYAAATKIASPRAFAQTTGQLGLPRIAVLVVPLAELVTAVLVLVAPTAVYTSVLLVAVGTGFAAAGLAALITKRRISCACFGQSGRTLGLRQVAYWPVWVLVALVPHLRTGSVHGRNGLTALMVIVAAMIVASLWRLRPYAAVNRELLRSVVPYRSP